LQLLIFFFKKLWKYKPQTHRNGKTKQQWEESYCLPYLEQNHSFHLAIPWFDKGITLGGPDFRFFLASRIFFNWHNIWYTSDDLNNSLALDEWLKMCARQIKLYICRFCHLFDLIPHRTTCMNVAIIGKKSSSSFINCLK
jgi:hypothetical protein